MPLSKYPCCVTRFSVEISNSGNFGSEKRPTAADINRSISGCIQTGKKLTTGGSAHGSHMIIGQTKALPMKTVEVRGLQDRISMGGNFRITLIVGHNN